MTLPGWFLPRLRSFWFGFTLPGTAARLILTTPSLIFWSLLPIGVTLGLYGYFVGTLQSELHVSILHYLQAYGLNAEGWLAMGLLLFSKFLLFLVSAFTFSFVASIAASPFNDFLAENAEKWAVPPLSKVTSSSFLGKFKLIGIDLLKTGAAMAATLLALLLSWVPIINVFAFSLAFLLVTFQYISYPQTRRGLGVRAGLFFLWRHFFSCLGFGLVFSFLFSIPLISSFSLPLAVVSGTLLVGRAPGTSQLWPLK